MNAGAGIISRAVLGSVAGAMILIGAWAAALAAETSGTAEAPHPVGGLSAAAGALAGDPLLQRFVVLQQLADSGDITPDEFTTRRTANLGALLPYSAPGPHIAALGAALAEPPSAEAIRQQLQTAAGFGADLGKVKRTMVLDTVLPAAPPAGQPAPAPLDRAKDRIVMLAAAGLVSRDEMQREVLAIYAASVPPPPPPAAKPAKVSPFKANRPWVH
jgi:hypothetical protein